MRRRVNAARLRASLGRPSLIKGIVVLAMLLVMPALHAYTLKETHTIILVSAVPSEPTAFRLVYNADLSQELTKPSDKVYSVRVTMDGATCDPGSELAQFRVHYDRDESVDPSSEGYSASIRMEIHTV